jgi:hypothetical protein
MCVAGEECLVRCQQLAESLPCLLLHIRGNHLLRLHLRYVHQVLPRVLPACGRPPQSALGLGSCRHPQPDLGKVGQLDSQTDPFSSAAHYAFLTNTYK